MPLHIKAKHILKASPDSVVFSRCMIDKHLECNMGLYTLQKAESHHPMQIIQDSFSLCGCQQHQSEVITM